MDSLCKQVKGMKPNENGKRLEFALIDCFVSVLFLNQRMENIRMLIINKLYV